jgi:hypothetical protein
MLWAPIGARVDAIDKPGETIMSRLQNKVLDSVKVSGPTGDLGSLPPLNPGGNPSNNGNLPPREPTSHGMVDAGPKRAP